MQSSEEKTLFLFREDIQRAVLFLMFGAVTLWVSVDVTDSTILKPFFLIIFAFLLVSLRVGGVLERGRLSWQRSVVDLWMVLSLLILTVSWIFSDFRVFGTAAYLTAAGSAICFFSGTQLFRERDKIERALFVLAVITLLVCALGVIQYFAGDRWGIDFGIGAARRVMSTMGNPAYLAGFLAMMIPLTLGWIFSVRDRKRVLVLSVLVVLMAIVLFLTQSRSGILALVCSVSLFIILRNRRNPRGIVIGIGIAIGVCGFLLVLLPGLGERLLSALDPTADSSFARRLPFWRAGWEAASSAPVLGHGPGSVPYVIALFRRADYWMNGSEDIVPHVHNEFLEAAIESGYEGALVLCVIMVFVIRQGLRAEEKSASGLAAGITSALVALLLDNMTGVSLRHPPVAMVAWFLAGLLFSPPLHKVQTSELQFRFGGSRLAGLLPLAAWIFLGFSLASDAVSKLGSDASVQSGRVASRAGKPQIAAGHFRAAVGRDSTNLIGSYELCVALLRTGEYGEAIETARKIRELVPHYPKVRLLESLAWLELDSLRLARLAINEELKRRDHPEAFYTQSLVAARMDDTPAVRASLEKVLERNIAANSTIHLEGTCRTLLDIAETRTDLQRLASLLEQLARRIPGNNLVNETLAEVRRRLQRDG
jgi:O-antigen ligase